MTVFVKVQAASILGSLADYLVTIALVSFFQWPYLLGNLIGNLTGGCAQFIICRKWAFRGGRGAVHRQALRFVLVFVGSLLLSAAGVFLLVNYFHVNYIIAKTAVSILLGTTYNYILQKRYVFG